MYYVNFIRTYSIYKFGGYSIMKFFLLILAIVWVLVILLTIYFKINFLGLDTNTWGLIFSAIFALPTSLMYFHERKGSGKKIIQQNASATQNSSIVQVGRDYKNGEQK